MKLLFTLGGTLIYSWFSDVRVQKMEREKLEKQRLKAEKEKAEKEKEQSDKVVTIVIILNLGSSHYFDRVRIPVSSLTVLC